VYLGPQFGGGGKVTPMEFTIFGFRNWIDFLGVVCTMLFCHFYIGLRLVTDTRTDKQTQGHMANTAL